MWGLFALRTRHPPPCSPSVYRGSTRGAGEGVEKNSSVTPCHLLCIKASEWRSWFPQVMNNQIHLFGGQYPLAVPIAGGVQFFLQCAVIRNPTLQLDTGRLHRGMREVQNGQF